jgi:hypothetical protein
LIFGTGIRTGVPNFLGTGTGIRSGSRVLKLLATRNGMGMGMGTRPTTQNQYQTCNQIFFPRTRPRTGFQAPFLWEPEPEPELF